ncbi:MAG: 2-dehydropantoate 2-reductase, partial [Deltaproteobacteria bacterium]|nr:2-dehydropantoate 2-reductase [Deltaproteobacteria bacterium]
MRFLIVGPGAMGCLFAACFKKAGFDVVLLDYIPERADLINEKGIHVEGVRGHYHVHVPTMVENLPWRPDLALICVKSYHTLGATRNIFPLLESESIVMTLQNGVGNIEILEGVFGKGRMLGGVTAEGATLIAPGRIRHAGEGDTVIGPGGD